MSDVLFVCVHNAGRSQMAEALWNRRAAELGIDSRAESAGTVAGGEINPTARLVMEEIGIPMDGQFPKQLTQEMIGASPRVITMGCGVDADSCPARFYVTEDWGLDDPKGQPVEKVREIRDEIRTRVNAALTASATVGAV